MLVEERGGGHAPPSEQPSLVNSFLSVSAHSGHSRPDQSGVEMDQEDTTTRFETSTNLVYYWHLCFCSVIVIKISVVFGGGKPCGDQ